MIHRGRRRWMFALGWLAVSAALSARVEGMAAERFESPVQTDPRRSGFTYMSRSTQALQTDDSQNPALLWVRDGERLWLGERHRSAGRPCVSCHGPAEASMRGIATRYPAWDSELGRPVTLAHRISLCSERHQGAGPLGPESDELLALEALIAKQSRGEPIASVSDPRLESALEQGRKLFATRIGQMALSCSDCHDQRSGERLGGSTIPQAHPTAYPIYRLQWQGLGSLSRRLRGCFSGVRAESPEAFGPVLSALELFLRARAAGMPHEGPGVRP